MSTTSNGSNNKPKTSVSETGHAKNVANFQSLIAFVFGYGTNYNPSKNVLKVPQLEAVLATAQSNLAEVINKNTAYNNTVNERMMAFSDLKGLSTRLVNALETTEADKEKVKDAKVYNRKLQGKRASTPATPTDPNTPAPNTISTSQQSYDQQIQHFAGLISVLQSEASYTPNETELQIDNLITKQTDLAAKNAAVATVYTSVSNARISRNKALYQDDSGLVSIATEVKKYVKSVFGATSQEYAQVKGIVFKTIKN
jgi:hypothetical protein